MRSSARKVVRHSDVMLVDAQRCADFLIGNQERMVDALARKSDEGRGVAAIRFGEVPSNL